MSPTVKSQVEKLGFKVPATPPPPKPTRATSSNGMSAEDAAAILAAIAESESGFVLFDKAYEATTKTPAADRARSAGYDLRVKLRDAGAIKKTGDLAVRVEKPDSKGRVKFWIGKDAS